MVDTFGQSSPLVAFRDDRPRSGSEHSRKYNNGVKSASPPQMYAPEAPMATEEYTGTTSVNSSPTKLPTTGRSNVSNGAGAHGSLATNMLIRKKGLPWLLASALVVIVALLILVAFLLYSLYNKGQYELHSQTTTASYASSSPAAPLTSSTTHPVRAKWPAPSLNSFESRFSRAALVSENGLCSEIGRKVLLQGGNAVDAAIAVTVCVGALNAHSCGLGGGFLMTYYQRFYGKCTTIDARETAPSRTNRDTYKSDPEEAMFGYKSVAVPGELHGHWTAFKRFGSGKVAWMDLLMPTANLLTDGYPASKLMELNLDRRREHILNGTHPGMRSLFVNPATGELFREGEIIRNPVLADTIKRLALSHDPIQLFYSANGEMARLIADEFASNGGLITRKDLHTYRSVVDDQPLLVSSEADPKLVLCGAKPSSGFALTQLIVATMLKFYPPGSPSSTPFDSDRFQHRLIEAQKHVFALRAKLGDVKFNKEAEAFAQNMTGTAFVEEIIKRIGERASTLEEFSDTKETVNPDQGTSQVVVVDVDGNAVSLTSSINYVFGSGIRSPQLGIVWNDHMGDFSQPDKPNFYGFAPAASNFIEPGKRPMSSMSPLIGYQKDTRRVRIVAGASGGSKIPSSVAQVVVQVLAFNHTLKQAIDTPRLHNQFTPFATFYEKGFPETFVTSLRVKGHNMSDDNAFALPSASVMAILRDENGQLLAANDHRREVHTYPMGY